MADCNHLWPINQSYREPDRNGNVYTSEDRERIHDYMVEFLDAEMERLKRHG